MVTRLRRMQLAAVYVFLVAFFCSGAAHAQIKSLPMDVMGAAGGDLSPGRWVRYSLVNLTNGAAILIKIAALERVKSKKAQWFEISMTSRARQLVFRALLQGTPGAAKQVLKAIVQPPGQVPFYLPQTVAAKQLPKAKAARSKGKLLGKVTLRTPAGRFSCRRYQRHSGPRRELVWVSSQLKGFSMVQYQSATIRVQLIGHGKGATTEIRGRPIKLDGRLLKGAFGGPK
jgi:hypothetical protein